MKENTVTRAYLSLLLLCPTLLSSTGCKLASSPAATNEASAKQTASSEPLKSITADISGDYTEHFSVKDGEHGGVGVGALGSVKKGTARFNISGNNEGPTQTTDLSVGFITSVGGIGAMTRFPGFLVGTRQDATGPFVKIVRGEQGETTYDDGAYWLFYDTQPERQPYAHVTFTKADKIASGNSMLVRYHLAGTFDFVAAYAPQPSDACAQEAAIYAGTHGPRHPMYKADLCQAKRIAVKGNFDITQDFPSDFVE